MDIAILKLRESRHDETRVRLGFSKMLSSNSVVHAIGFPSYAPGHKQVCSSHRVTSIRTLHGVETMEVDGILQGGMSGGPLIDESMNVVGIIRTGIVGTQSERELARNYVTSFTHALKVAEGVE